MMECDEKIKGTVLIARGDLSQMHRLNIPSVLNTDGSSGILSYNTQEDSGCKAESTKMAPNEQIAGCMFWEPLNLRPVIPCDQFIRNYNNTNTNTFISKYESYRRKFQTKRRRTSNVHKRCTTKAEDLSKVAEPSCSAIDCIAPSTITDSVADSSQMKMPMKRRRTSPAWLTSGDLPQLHRLNIPTVLNMDGSSGMFSYDDKYEDSGFKTESEKMAPTKKVAGCIFGEPLNLRPVIPCDQFIRNYNNTNTNTYISIYESYRRKFKTKRRRTANVHKRCTTKAEDLSKVAKRSCSAIDCIGPSSKTDSEAGSSQMKMPTKRRRTEPAWLTSGDYQLF